MHLFVSESLLSASLYTHVKQGGAAPSQRMTRGEVMKEASFLSRLLQNEFVYGTEGLAANVNSTLTSLAVRRRLFLLLCEKAELTHLVKCV